MPTVNCYNAVDGASFYFVNKNMIQTLAGLPGFAQGIKVPLIEEENTIVFMGIKLLWLHLIHSIEIGSVVMSGME